MKVILVQPHHGSATSSDGSSHGYTSPWLRHYDSFSIEGDPVDNGPLPSQFEMAAVKGAYCPPLGICYLAACLEQAGHEVEILDMNIEGMDDDQAKSYIEKLKPSIVGITSTIANAENARRLGLMLQDLYPVVHGGPEASVSPNDFLYSNQKSIVLKGEAESTFVEMVNRMKAGKPITDIDGLSYFDGSTVRHNPVVPSTENIDDIPFPARHLCKMDAYQATMNGRPATNIMGSRSCPFKCTFCHDGNSGTAYRRRSPQNVVSEMSEIVNKHNIKAFYFYDCTATLEPEWIRQLCQLIIAQKLDITWSCLSRVGALELADMELMKRAGCLQICVGVESGSARSLSLIRKGITTQQATEFIKRLSQAGIMSHVYLMLGFPWETVDDFQGTLDFARNAKPDVAEVSFVTPFKDTVLYNEVISSNKLTIFNDTRAMIEPAFVGPGFTRESLYEYRNKILQITLYK